VRASDGWRLAHVTSFVMRVEIQGKSIDRPTVYMFWERQPATRTAREKTETMMRARR
jgi:hypothetical protein